MVLVCLIAHQSELCRTVWLKPTKNVVIRSAILSYTFGMAQKDNLVLFLRIFIVWLVLWLESRWLFAVTCPSSPNNRRESKEITLSLSSLLFFCKHITHIIVLAPTMLSSLSLSLTPRAYPRPLLLQPSFIITS